MMLTLSFLNPRSRPQARAYSFSFFYAATMSLAGCPVGYPAGCLAGSPADKHIGYMTAWRATVLLSSMLSKQHHWVAG